MKIGHLYKVDLPTKDGDFPQRCGYVSLPVSNILGGADTGTNLLPCSEVDDHIWGPDFGSLFLDKAWGIGLTERE